ncbi:hypothetical protein QCD58_004692 [Enterobacter hormaechei]|nr:hypothetical protein [Enterobacter hormaechei]
MHRYLSAILFTLVVSTPAFAASPGMTIKADKLESLSDKSASPAAEQPEKSTSLASGHVVINTGNTQIRSDTAKIVTEKDKVTIYADSLAPLTGLKEKPGEK